MSIRPLGAKLVPLTLRVRRDLLPEIDQAAHALHMNRTVFIRTCIRRGLERFKEVELPLITERLQRQSRSANGRN